MGDGMPYHLEKGPLLRIFESYLNGDRPTLEARLDVLRASEQNDSLEWIVNGVPALWNDPAFAAGPQTGDQMRRRLLTEWFGYEDDGAGGWQKPQPPPATTGYWIGYRGDVDKIVRRAVLWAIQLALSTGSDTATAHDRPWPIELFWKCPAPWFEAWVVSRRVPTTGAGLVTLVLVTPSHKGADVALSPIASSPVATPAGATHPVPSWQDDYELLTFPSPLPQSYPVSAKHPDPLVANRPRVPARQRDFATWVVTHAQHGITGDPEDSPPLTAARRARQKNTAGPRLFGDFEIPQLAEWEGTDDVVVVSPSMAAGGVKHDGRVV